MVDRAVTTFKKQQRKSMINRPDTASWNIQRSRALVRDKHKCVDCGMTQKEHKRKYNSSLHVHHITPRSEFESAVKMHALDNLVTVCCACHRKREGDV